MSTETIYVCDRCKITQGNRQDTMCPCPRGGCEAREILIPTRTFTTAQVESILSNVARSYGIQPSIILANWERFIDKPKKSKRK